MRHTLAVIGLLMLTGCSTYGTHLRTGCVWSCDKWAEQESQMASTGGPIPNLYQPHSQTVTNYITPIGGYMAIRNGSTTTVIQTSRTK